MVSLSRNTAFQCAAQVAIFFLTVTVSKHQGRPQIACTNVNRFQYISEGVVRYAHDHPDYNQQIVLGLLELAVSHSTASNFSYVFKKTVNL